MSTFLTSLVLLNTRTELWFTNYRANLNTSCFSVSNGVRTEEGQPP